GWARHPPAPGLPLLMRDTRRQASRGRRLAGVVATCLCLLFCAQPRAADAELAEYQVKAAYLYNFITLTEWPAAIGANLPLCVYGPDPFGDDIDALAGKNVGG